MASHIIHIKIAQDINKKLRLDNDSIMLGSVLPDLTTIKNRTLSHFQYKDEYPYNLANADEFIKKYPDMKDDISIGYIIHLLTDEFYNDWYYKNYKLKGINHTKELKHTLFESYDKYILKHFELDIFSCVKVVEQIPDYLDLNFDKEYIKEYILKYNKKVDENRIDKNYTIKNVKILNKLYNDCLEYVLNKLEETNLRINKRS